MRGHITVDTDSVNDHPDVAAPPPTRTPASGRDYRAARSWPLDHRLTVRAYDNEVVIEGDKIALRSLAELLLTLSESDTPLSAHFHLEASAGQLTPGSVNLVLDHDEWNQ
ncbi:Imm32 family immunity protein [Microtetraspora fusca]